MLNPAWIQCFLFDCRSPHGERGLKYPMVKTMGFRLMSLPAWGAWIEIVPPLYISGAVPSLPAWGAWIEMARALFRRFSPSVAPRMGSVD